LSGQVDDGGARRGLDVAADAGDAAVLHDDSDAALGRGAAAVDQGGVGEGGDLRRGGVREQQQAGG
jgi:hypothetical protein